MGSLRVGKLKDNHKDSATHIRRRFLFAPKENTKHNILYNTIKTSVSLAALLGQRASHRVRLASLRHIAFDRGCQCTPLHGFCGAESLVNFLRKQSVSPPEELMAMSYFGASWDFLTKSNISCSSAAISYRHEDTVT